MNYQIILTYSSITYFLVAVRDLTDFFYRCFIFAGIEGFEPTTIGLTGHRSNHCSYIPKLIIKSSYIILILNDLWTRRESNSPLSPCKGETPALEHASPFAFYLFSWEA